MEYKMHLREHAFYMFKAGKQDIEMRLYDEKRQKIKVGDTIEFSNQETGQTINTEVVGIHVFENFEQLYNNFDKQRIGYEEDAEANPSDMSQFYSVPEINKYGVVAIQTKLI